MTEDDGPARAARCDCAGQFAALQCELDAVVYALQFVLSPRDWERFKERKGRAMRALAATGAARPTDDQGEGTE